MILDRVPLLRDNCSELILERGIMDRQRLAGMINASECHAKNAITTHLVRRPPSRVVSCIKRKSKRGFECARNRFDPVLRHI